MSIWSKLIGIKKTEDRNNIIGNKTTSVPCSAHNYAIVDVEIGLKDHRIHDMGALKHDNTTFHKISKEELFIFLNDVDYICGHNIVHHDAKYLFTDKICRWILVDTLYVSPLLFPERPYHRLVKDDKLMSEQMNNPVNDCKKAKDLLLDEIACWHSLPKEKRILFASLLKDKKEFEGFLSMVSAEYIHKGIPELIKELYAGKICQHADLDMLINQYPCGLAYALALIDTTDYRSITPGWVLYNYPEVEFIIKLLRHTTCKEGCDYCHTQLDVLHNLKTFFGYERFRTYEGEPLQERAAQAAVKGKSLLAIFPTGGGKSLTFQLPALMAGHSVHGLAVFDERPGRQPCRQRNHGCRNHKWDVRPHHKITVNTKSTRRRSLVVVYLSRNAPFKNNRENIDGAPRCKVCDRRSALLFFMGAGFQS